MTIKQIRAWHLSWLWPDASERNNLKFKLLIISHLYLPSSLLYTMALAWRVEKPNLLEEVLGIAGFIHFAISLFFWPISLISFLLILFCSLWPHKKHLLEMSRQSLQLFVIVSLMWILSFGSMFTLAYYLQMNGYWYFGLVTIISIYYLCKSRTVSAINKNTSSA